MVGLLGGALSHRRPRSLRAFIGREPAWDEGKKVRIAQLFIDFHLLQLQILLIKRTK